MSEELSAFAKKRKSKKIWRFILISLLVLALFGTASYFVLENYFVANEVAVQKSTIYDAKDLLSCANIKKGVPLYKLDRNKVRTNLEAKFPYLVDIKIKYSLPDGVKIVFREEFGEFSLNLGTELFAVDRNLNVLAKEDGTRDIRRIRVISSDVKSCVVGEKLSFIDEGTLPILESMIDQLDKKKLMDTVTEINVSEKFNLSLRYADRFLVIMGDQEDLDLKLAMMKEVIRDLGESASGRIDLVDPDNAYVKLEDPIS